MSMPGRVRTSGVARGAALLEALLVVLVLAVAVPMAMSAATTGTKSRMRSANITKATALAELVLETVMADVHSSNDALGFDALADSDAYLTTPGTGLVARLGTLASPYTDAGFGYAVTVGPLVGPDGVTTGDADEDVFRLVTVTVSAPEVDSDANMSIPVSVLVAGSAS